MHVCAVERQLQFTGQRHESSSRSFKRSDGAIWQQTSSVPAADTTLVSKQLAAAHALQLSPAGASVGVAADNGADFTRLQALPQSPPAALEPHQAVCVCAASSTTLSATHLLLVCLSLGAVAACGHCAGCVVLCITCVVLPAACLSATGLKRLAEQLRLQPTLAAALWLFSAPLASC